MPLRTPFISLSHTFVCPSPLHTAPGVVVTSPDPRAANLFEESVPHPGASSPKLNGFHVRVSLMGFIPRGRAFFMPADSSLFLDGRDGQAVAAKTAPPYEL
jgi:hypothetical protein